MNIRNLRGKKLLLIGVAAVCTVGASSAFAGTIDSSDNFYPLYQWVNANLSGGLGTSICLGMTALGAFGGMVKNSPIPLLSGIGAAIGLHYAPQVITSLMTSGAVF